MWLTLGELKKHQLGRSGQVRPCKKDPPSLKDFCTYHYHLYYYIYNKIRANLLVVAELKDSDPQKSNYFLVDVIPTVSHFHVNVEKNTEVLSYSFDSIVW